MNTEQLQAEFEAWYTAQYTSYIPRSGNGYSNLDTELAWQAYQAGRISLQSQKPKGNDIMLSGVIRMPFEMAMADPISRMQFYQRAQQALNELEALQHSCKETSQDRELVDEEILTVSQGIVEERLRDKEDAERWRYGLKHGFPQKWEEMVRGNLRIFWTSSAGAQEEFPNAIEAIDYARRIEGDRE